MTEFVTPPPLDPGDRVAVIAPSSGGAASFPHVLDLALERLRDVFEIEPVVFPTARQGDDFLAANPRARAADIHAAFQNPSITGVFATIGGSDQLRVLRHLDPETLRAHPTRFFGMSDNTNLGLFLWTHGVVSFNGAQLMNELGVPGALPEYTERYARRAFFDNSLGRLAPSEGWTDAPTDWWPTGEIPDESSDFEPNPEWTWAGGSEAVAGRLWGGCLAVVDWHLATDRYLPDPSRLDGAVLCIETAEDLPDPDDVAMTLTCMGERGLLDRFAGVLVGRAPGRSFLEQPPKEQREAYRQRVRDAVVETVADYNPDAPVVAGLDWGHTTPTAPLPVGRRVEIDPTEESIVFPEEE